MADWTGFFPSSGVAPHNCPYSDYWTDTSGAAHLPMPSSKGTSGIAARHPNHSPGNDYDLGGQWVSNAMPARSWTTADTFEFAMMFKDGNNPPTTFITHLSIRVFNAAGDTEVGVLFEGQVNASAWISSFRSRHCDGIALQNSVNMPEYGHLVVEIGGYATYDATYGGDMVVGEGTSTALPLNDTETNTDLYPWIAFTYGGAGGYTLACDGGSYALTGTALTPKRDGKIVPDGGSYALTGQIAGVYYGRAIDADSGSYAITGSNASLLRAALLALGSGAYALTGSDAAVLLGRLLSTEAGTYVLTGAAIAALYGRAIDADAGAYVITGQDAALLRAARLAVEAGTYVLTGQDVTLTYVPGAGAYILSCSSGTYAIVGGDAGLRRDARIAPEAGTYTLTGQAAATLLGRLVNAGAGAYVLTGQDVTLTYVPGVGAYLLSCEGGTYATAGSNLNLIYSGEAGVLKRWTGTAWVNVNVIVLYGG